MVICYVGHLYMCFYKIIKSVHQSLRLVSRSDGPKPRVEVVGPKCRVTFKLVPIRDTWSQRRRIILSLLLSYILDGLYHQQHYIYSIIGIS